METIFNPAVWESRGSSVIFDHLALSRLINEAEMVSLRKVLSWLDDLPDDPPAATILVAGLETMINVLDVEAANEFLLQRIRPLIIKLQNNWPVCGLVFGFTAAPQAFKIESVNDEVLYRKLDQSLVKLSEGLWDGSATMNMKRMAMKNTDGKETTIGYYVARIS